MKLLVIMLTFACSTFSFGQNTVQTSSVQAFESVSGLTQLDSLSILDITGEYINSNGFAGYRITLDSNQNFQMTGFDCMSRSKVDSGKWSLQNGNTLILSSDKTVSYDIIKLENYHFIIHKSQRQKFIKDYTALWTKFKNIKPFTRDGITYTAEFIIGYSLLNKYFAKGLNDYTGT